MFRTVLITLVGAVPATLLSVLAFLLAGVGSGLIADGDIADGILSIAYGLIAILGTISLWFAAFYPITLPIRLGLVGGVLTALPWLFVIARDGPGISDPKTIGLFFLLGCPVVVATVLLIDGTRWFSSGHRASSTQVIDNILARDNYSRDVWLARGVDPSDETRIQALEIATTEFLIALKSGLRNSNDVKAFVSKLVDDLPWHDFDIEERGFLADVLAPAIESAGLDPWQIY